MERPTVAERREWRQTFVIAQSQQPGRRSRAKRERREVRALAGGAVWTGDENRPAPAVPGRPPGHGASGGLA
jgi:hypothetical protein